jgi:hypothetical protein
MGSTSKRGAESGERGLWPLVWASYALAAVNYGVNHLPWGQLPSDLLLAINRSAWLTGTASFLLWCAVAAFAARRFKRRAWPILLGAPFALATFIGVVLFVLVSILVPH